MEWWALKRGRWESNTWRGHRVKGKSWLACYFFPFTLQKTQHLKSLMKRRLHSFSTKLRKRWWRYRRENETDIRERLQLVNNTPNGQRDVRHRSPGRGLIFMWGEKWDLEVRPEVRPEGARTKIGVDFSSTSTPLFCLVTLVYLKQSGDILHSWKETKTRVTMWLNQGLCEESDPAVKFFSQCNVLPFHVASTQNLYDQVQASIFFFFFAMWHAILVPSEGWNSYPALEALKL